MKLKVVGIGSIILIAGLVIACFALGFFDQKEEQPPVPIRESRLYRGVDYTVYSKSYVDQPKSSYVFENVLQYDYVEHDFIIKNNSSEPLEILKAEGCCGCSVSSYSKQIPPGLTGKISVLIITDTSGGETLNGTIRAQTNDPDIPEITIEISCYIKKIAEIFPYKIIVKGSYHDDLEGTSTIIPDDGFPFNIIGIRPKKGLDIRHSLKEIKQNGKKGYVITVKNTRKEIGVYRDTLFIQTDNPKRPEFRIRIEGDVAE